MHARHIFLFCYIRYWLASLFPCIPNCLCHTGRSFTSWRIPRLSGFAHVGYPLPSLEHRYLPPCRSTRASSAGVVRDLSEGCLFRVSPWPPGRDARSWQRCFPVRLARCGYRRRHAPACRCAAVHRHARRPCSAPPPCAAGRWPAPSTHSPPLPAPMPQCHNGPYPLIPRGRARPSGAEPAGLRRRRNRPPETLRPDGPRGEGASGKPGLPRNGRSGTDGVRRGCHARPNLSGPWTEGGHVPFRRPER